MAKEEESAAALLNMQAREAFTSGRTRPFEWRVKQLDAISSLLREQEEEINNALQEDLGKSPFEAFITEAAIALNSCEFIKANLKQWMRPQTVALPIVSQPASGAVTAEPYGVVLIFSTWNFPLLLALDPLIGAVAAGNVVVLKLSEVAPAVSSVLAKAIPKYLDPYAVKVVEGGIKENECLLNQKWDKIFFTGSTHVGKIVMAAAAKQLTPVTLELGGKCPAIVDSTTDFQVAARRIASGKWGINLGQTCLAPDYILVEEKSVQKLVRELKTALEEFFGTDAEKCSDLPRIVNTRHFSRLKAYLDEADTAKTIVHGGRCNDARLFIEPTLLLDPPLDTRVMTEEIFGPLLPIITLHRSSDAIEFLNARDKPLAIYMFTEDEGLKNGVTTQTTSGAVLVNDACIHFGLDSFPFGGVGASGMGAYHGKYSFECFSHMKPILMRYTRCDIQVRYPPYTPAKQRIVRCIARFQYFKLLLVLVGLGRWLS